MHRPRVSTEKCTSAVIDFLTARIAARTDPADELREPALASAAHRLAMDKEILPNICGLDFDAHATLAIQLERTQTLAGGANHCNFRFSRLPSD